MSWYDSGDGTGPHFTSRSEERRQQRKAQRAAKSKGPGCMGLLIMAAGAGGTIAAFVAAAEYAVRLLG